IAFLGLPALMETSMTRFASLVMLFAMGWLLAPAPASATTTADILTVMWAMRGQGVALLQVPDKESRINIINEIKKSSQDITNMVATMEADPNTPADVRARLEEFKPLWAEFQATRDGEAFPAVLAGDIAKAQNIGVMVQVARFRRLALLLQ